LCEQLKAAGMEKSVRLDKFLKVSRLIKRRTVANDACDAGRVTINGKPAKASATVKVGDIIEVGFGSKAVKVEVVDVQETTRKDDAKELYKYI
jgi:ribosomal 50S subunit-recycling heat shock protein